MRSSDSEEWRPVPGMGGRYEVSSHGGVRSYLRRGGRQKVWPDPVPLRTYPSNGYRTVNFDQRTRLLHRVVCETFNGPAPAGMSDCRHLDGDPLNNRSDNLAWGTRSDNERDKVGHGRSNRGERCGNAKLTAHDVLEIRRLKATGQFLNREIAEHYPVGKDHISMIVNRKTWAHI